MKNVLELNSKEVKALTSTQLRKAASELKVKGYAKFSKVDLQAIVIKQIKVQLKAVVSDSKKPSKSSILRSEIVEMKAQGLNIDSGSLMKVMKEKFGLDMHRSFIITVRNKFKKALGE